MKNTISHRVADFLKNFPPFNFLHQKDLEKLARDRESEMEKGVLETSMPDGRVKWVYEEILLQE